MEMQYIYIIKNILKMKNTLLFVLILLMVSPAWSQKRKKKQTKKETPTVFFLDVHGRYGLSEYINSNISNDANVEALFTNPSSSFGAKLGVDFGFGVGLAFEVGSTSFSQSYDIKSDNDGSSFTHITQASGMTKTILLRHNDLGSYIEAGPQFVSIKSGDNYTNFTNIVVGFGAPLYYHNNFDINLGLRVNYALSDVMNAGKYPNESINYNPIYDSYAKTSVFSAQLTLGVNWHIGYFAKAKCDGHVEFLFM